MTWLKKLSNKLAFSHSDDDESSDLLDTTVYPPASRETYEKVGALIASLSWQTDDTSLPTEQLHLTQPHSKTQPEKKGYNSRHIPSNLRQKVTGPDNDAEINANINALNKLRGLPRGSQVESRIKAIQALLGDREVFRTLHNLRWPQGVVCPRCRSNNVVRRDPPPEAEDARYFYECLNCKGSGNPGRFDDLTGLPIEDAVRALRQWILCWYLLGFCSIAQIAKILGLSLSEVSELASLGSNLVELPESGMLGSYKSKSGRTNEEKRQTEIKEDQDRTSSASLGRYKPGPKSKM